MAMICITGCRECTGCMACQAPLEMVETCDICKGPIYKGETYLGLQVEGHQMHRRVVVCERCQCDARVDTGEEMT